MGDFMKKLIFLLFAILIFTEFTLAQYPRKIVFENFTNLGCGSCLLAGNSVNPWIKNHEEIIPITYHAGFPSGSDTMYLYAKEQINYRLSKFYKTPFVPFGRIMGIPVPHPEYTGHPADTNRINEYVSQISNQSSFKIDLNYYIIHYY